MNRAVMLLKTLLRLEESIPLPTIAVSFESFLVDLTRSSLGEHLATTWAFWLPFEAFACSQKWMKQRTLPRTGLPQLTTVYILRDHIKDALLEGRLGIVEF